MEIDKIVIDKKTGFASCKIMDEEGDVIEVEFGNDDCATIKTNMVQKNYKRNENG